VIGVLGVLAALTGVVPMAVVFTPIGRFLGFAWIVVATVFAALRLRRAVPAEADL
jgi:hypothetical protein